MRIKTIAETAAHHEGDYSFMANLLENILKSGADIVKVHVTQDIDEYMDSSHAVYGLLQRLCFDSKQWKEIFSLIKSSSKSLMTLVNDSKAVELAAESSPDYYEIHSVALNDVNLLGALSSNLNEKSKVVLGVGGSTLEEIESAITCLGTDRIVLMFGFQNYPTNYPDINFNKIRRIMKLFPEFQYGYADHTAWNEPNNVLVTLLGAALGVNYIEKHVTTECGFERTDSSAAINFDQFEQICAGLKVLDACNGNGRIELSQAENKYCVYGPMKKAPMLKDNRNAGHEISVEDICFKRTSVTTDISQIQILKMIGKKLSRDLTAGAVLRSSDFQE